MNGTALLVPPAGAPLPLLHPACGVWIGRCRGYGIRPDLAVLPRSPPGGGRWGPLTRQASLALASCGCCLVGGGPSPRRWGARPDGPSCCPRRGGASVGSAWAFCGAPGALRVVPQVPEAERWCRSRPRGPLLRLPPWGLRVGPEEKRSARRRVVVEAIDRGFVPLDAGLRGCLGFRSSRRRPHPSLPWVSLSASVGGPARGDRWVGECDPPSVRKPSLAIPEVCFGGTGLPRPAASLCVVVALPRGDWIRSCVGRVPSSSSVAGRSGVRRSPRWGPSAARRLLWPAPPPSESGEGPAGPGPVSSPLGRSSLEGWVRVASRLARDPLPLRAGSPPAPVPCRALAGAGDRAVCGATGRAAWARESVPTVGRAGLPERDRVADGRDPGCVALASGLSLWSLRGPRRWGPGPVRGLRGGAEGRPVSRVGGLRDRPRVCGGGIPWSCLPRWPGCARGSRPGPRRAPVPLPSWAPALRVRPLPAAACRSFLSERLSGCAGAAPSGTRAGSALRGVAPGHHRPVSASPRCVPRLRAPAAVGPAWARWASERSGRPAACVGKTVMGRWPRLRWRCWGAAGPREACVGRRRPGGRSVCRAGPPLCAQTGRWR